MPGEYYLCIMPTEMFDAEWRIVWLFLGFDPGPFIPVKVNVIATAYKDILDNCILLTL